MPRSMPPTTVFATPTGLPLQIVQNSMAHVTQSVTRTVAATATAPLTVPSASPTLTAPTTENASVIMTGQERTAPSSPAHATQSAPSVADLRLVTA